MGSGLLNSMCNEVDFLYVLSSLIWRLPSELSFKIRGYAGNWSADNQCLTANLSNHKAKTKFVMWCFIVCFNVPPRSALAAVTWEWRIGRPAEEQWVEGTRAQCLRHRILCNGSPGEICLFANPCGAPPLGWALLWEIQIYQWTTQKNCLIPWGVCTFALIF